MKYYLQMFTNFLDFRGRSGIKEYWIATLFNLLFNFLIELLALPFIADIDVFLMVAGSLASLYGVIVFLPGLSLIVRRLHDTGHSGLFLLITIIPVIGTIVIIYLLCQPSIYKTEIYHKDFYKHDDELYNATYIGNIDEEKEPYDVNDNIQCEIKSTDTEISKQIVKQTTANVDEISVPQINESKQSKKPAEDGELVKTEGKNTKKSKASQSLVKKTRVQEIKECQQLLQDGVITKEEYDSRVLKILSR